MPARTISQWIQLPYIKKLSHETRDFLFNLIMACDEEGFLVIDAKMIPKMFDTTRTHVDPAKEEDYFKRNLGELTEYDENGSTIIVFSRKVLPAHTMRTNYIWVQRWEEICKPRYKPAHPKYPPNPGDGDNIIHGNIPAEIVSLSIPSSPLDALIRQSQKAHEFVEELPSIIPSLVNTNPVASPLREVPLIEAGTEELASFFAPVQTIVHPPVQVQPLDPYASIPDPLGGLGDPLQVTLQDETAMPPVEEDHHTQRFDASKVIESLGQTDEWPVLVDRVNAVLAKVGKATTDGDIRGLLTASEREPRSAVKLLELVDISDPEYAGASGVAVLRKVWEA